MLFENQEIHIETLPQVEVATFQKLAKNYVTVRYIGSALFFFALSLGIATLFMETNILEHPILKYGIVAFWLFWFIATLILVKLGYKVRGYVLREKDIIHRKGVLFKSTTTIPFNRVQHCEISQGPIQRIFNLHTLEIFTAGGSKSDLAIPGLEGDIAQQIRTFIVKRMDEIDEETASINEATNEQNKEIDHLDIDSLEKPEVSKNIEESYNNPINPTH